MSADRRTYQELADHWGVTVPAAKQRVRRAGWKRLKGNDGVVRVIIPEDTERMVTTVPLEKEAENKALETLRDTVSNLTDVTVKQAERIEKLTTALLSSQDQNTSLRERISELESLRNQVEQKTPSRRKKGLIERMLRVLYDGDT